MNFISAKNRSSRYVFYIKLILLIWFGLFAFINADAQSLWADELSSIGFIRHGLSLREMFSIYLYLDTNLPLYSLILYGWYRVCPYGEEFLLLPSILFCIAGIICLSKAAERMAGKKSGLIVFLLCICSNAILWQGAWEARCYALVFFLAALTMYAYIAKTIAPPLLI